MGTPSRNAPCPCGSGRKYKRCCLPHEELAGGNDRFEDEVGRRISGWSAARYRDEIPAALEEFGIGEGEVMHDADLQLFVTWCNSDREVVGGGTPCARYAVLPELDDREREVAQRIAAAQLGLYRVEAVEPGRWMELEEVVGGRATLRVRSPDVSREAARWDVLLCRVMAGEPLPSLWGPALFFRPDEEPELLDELHRLATAHGLSTDPDGLATACRVGARELVRFVPPSRRVEPSFFTAEGDPVVNACAVWSIPDPDAAFERLDTPPELLWVGEGDDGGEVFQWTGDRADLVARRPPLPPGALCFESTLTGLPGRIGLATFTLTEIGLDCHAISEARLAGAIDLVAERLRDLAELRQRTVSPFEPDLSPGRPRPPAREPPPGLTRAEARMLERELLEDRYRAWLDEPLEALGGHTPRQAAKTRRRGQLELLLRGIENRAERARREGAAWPDVTWLRDELGLAEDRAA